MPETTATPALVRRRFAYPVFVAALVGAVGVATMVLAPSEPGASPTPPAASLEIAANR